MKKTVLSLIISILLIGIGSFANINIAKAETSDGNTYRYFTSDDYHTLGFGLHLADNGYTYSQPDAQHNALNFDDNKCLFVFEKDQNGYWSEIKSGDTSGNFASEDEKKKGSGYNLGDTFKQLVTLGQAFLPFSTAGGAGKIMTTAMPLSEINNLGKGLGGYEKEDIFKNVLNENNQSLYIRNSETVLTKKREVMVRGAIKGDSCVPSGSFADDMRSNISNSLRRDINDQVDPAELMKIYGDFIILKAGFGGFANMEYVLNKKGRRSVSDVLNKTNWEVMLYGHNGRQQEVETSDWLEKNGTLSVSSGGNIGGIPGSMSDSGFGTAFASWVSSGLSNQNVNTYIGPGEKDVFNPVSGANETLANSGVYIWNLIDPTIMTGDNTGETCIQNDVLGNCIKRMGVDKEKVHYFPTDCSPLENVEELYNLCKEKAGKQMSYAEYVQTVFIGILNANAHKKYVPTFNGKFVKDIFIGREECNKIVGSEPEKAGAGGGGKLDEGLNTRIKNNFCEGNETSHEKAVTNLMDEMNKNTSNNCQTNCVYLVSERSDLNNFTDKVTMLHPVSDPDGLESKYGTGGNPILIGVDGKHHSGTVVGYTLTSNINEAIVDFDVIHSPKPIEGCDRGSLFGTPNSDKPYCQPGLNNPVDLNAGIYYNCDSGLLNCKREGNEWTYIANVKRFNQTIDTDADTGDNIPLTAIGVSNRYLGTSPRDNIDGNGLAAVNASARYFTDDSGLGDWKKVGKDPITNAEVQLADPTYLAYTKDHE